MVYTDGQSAASSDQLVIAEHEILDGCPETGPDVHILVVN